MRVRFVVPTSRSRRSRLRHHVGDAKAPADLHQLGARYQHVAPARQRRKDQERRGGAIVDDDRRFGARQSTEERLGVSVPCAAGPLLQVILEIRVAVRQSTGALPRGICERRTAKVRVDDDARGVQHAGERRPES